ncbi:FAD-dependent oxidoreductase [Thioflexithrix psekupsensis]|uniref:FAD-dependent oxidoreductase n=1 Tax=Thioflexithrix psekupsensis TaxID=1570016 RepID=A0A251X4G2_9GAMM|nr:FAD-dependent oxidoreductase [Thioflexithrix psekupsensis]OUD12280.1 hypothetical protein TPSD3_14275 [Thioflexithrix psekupsensis]
MYAKSLSASQSCAPLVVVGAGAAGISCALAAALRGVEVYLLEKTAAIGGTVTQTLIHTLGGLFDSEGELLHQGLPAQLLERLLQASPHTKKRRIGKTWVLDVDPARYAQVVTDWMAAISHIKILCQTTISSINIENQTITQLVIHSEGQTLTLQPSVLIDTSGNAEVVRLINPDLVHDGMALGGYIVQLRGIAAGTLVFPKGVALLHELRRAVTQHALPPECASVWLDNGVYPDEIYVKFNIVVSNYQQTHMQAVAMKLLDYLRHIDGFSDARIQTHGELGVRDGGRIQGEYCLTEADVIAGRQFEDAACLACWPIEHWHPEKGITLQYLPSGQAYTIPLRSLKVAGFTNLWAVGKCLSAEPRAQASARVVGTCWAMGEAVGQHLAERLTWH